MTHSCQKHFVYNTFSVNVTENMQKRAAKQTQKQLRREEAEHKAWLHVQAHTARLAQEAESRAQLQQER